MYVWWAWQKIFQWWKSSAGGGLKELNRSWRSSTPVYQYTGLTGWKVEMENAEVSKWGWQGDSNRMKTDEKELQ